MRITPNLPVLNNRPANNNQPAFGSNQGAIKVLDDLAANKITTYEPQEKLGDELYNSELTQEFIKKLNEYSEGIKKFIIRAANPDQKETFRQLLGIK